MSQNTLPAKLSEFSNPIKPPRELLVVAGPCVIENEEILYKTAAGIKTICKELKLPFVFKASFDKANRTSINSFRGPGLKEGLKILQELKNNLEILVTSDVHSVEQVEPAAEVLDIIQIPAFLCRQTDLLLAAGKTGRIINIKKGQFLAPKDIRHIAEKVKSTGNKSIIFTERGSSFGYNNLVSDFRAVPIIQDDLGYPLMFDATHSVQLPGASGSVSGGEGRFAPLLAACAAAAGVFGIWLETHPKPEEALSDGPNMIPLANLKSLLTRCKLIREACLKTPLSKS